MADLLADLDESRSAQDVRALLVGRGTPIGLRTVYRTCGSSRSRAVYRRGSTGHHHHHLVCRRCGRTVEVEGPEVERSAQRVAHEHGFTQVEHAPHTRTLILRLSSFSDTPNDIDVKINGGT